MQLVFICNEYPPCSHGGIGSSVEMHARTLAGEGAHVLVVGVYGNLAEEQDEMQDGVRVVRLPFEHKGNWRLDILFNRWKLRRRLLAEHRKTPLLLIEAPDYEGWMPFGFPGCPVITRFHGSNIFFDHLLDRKTNGMITIMERRQAASSQAYIGVSRFALETSRRLVNLKEKPRRVIYYLVDTNIFVNGQSEQSPEGRHVFFVNSLNPRKGVAELVQAMPQVLEKFPDAVLNLVGKPSSKIQDMESHLLSLIDPKYHSAVKFWGFVPHHDLPDLLRRAAVCVYPSFAETFGLGPVEAMAVGRPVIYSQLGPGPEVVEHEVSGLLIDPHDPADIAAKINQMLSDPDAAEKMAKNGRERVLRLFHRETVLKSNLEFYRSLGVDLSRAGLA